MLKKHPWEMRSSLNVASLILLTWQGQKIFFVQVHERYGHSSDSAVISSSLFATFGLGVQQLCEIKGSTHFG